MMPKGYISGEARYRQFLREIVKYYDELSPEGSSLDGLDLLTSIAEEAREMLKDDSN